MYGNDRQKNGTYTVGSEVLSVRVRVIDGRIRPHTVVQTPVKYIGTSSDIMYRNAK